MLLIVTSPLAAQSKKDRERAKNLQDQADKAFTQKNYRAAVDSFAQALAIVPNNSYAHYRKGFAHFNLKENDQAVSEFTLALSQGFKPIEIYRIRYFVYFELRNFDAALADIQKGLQLAPNDLNFLSAVGEIYFARQSYPEALAAYQKASQLAPNNADIFYNIARVYFAIGDTKGQAAAAESAIAKGTRFPGEAHYMLGDAYQKQRNVPGAIGEYQKAINSKPDLYQAYRNLAAVYRGENRFIDAIDTSKQ
ncbi:MAG: tetratricopeptide repeat protein, partial [Pyrinomonadaceae bacterium]